MTEKDDKGSFERARKQILDDKSTTEQQKETLLKQLAKTVIPPETKVLDIKISNEIPQKNQDALDIAEKMRETMKLRFLEFGLEPPSMRDLEEMDKATAILKALKQKNEPHETPSGVASLEAQYASMQKGSGNQVGFESADAMIQSLYARKDPEAKQILDQLWKKAYQGFKDKKYNSDSQEITAPEDFLQKCVKKSDEYKKWLDENRRGSA